MQRVLTALIALCLCVGVAYPRAIVLFPNRSISNQASQGGFNKQQESDFITSGIVRAWLDKFNPGGWDAGDIKQARTSLIYSGNYRGNQYSEVIWVGIPQTQAFTQKLIGCDACSLSISTGYLPTVPHLWILPPVSESGYNAITAACSLGFNQETFDPDFQGPGYATARVRLEGTPYIWPAPVGLAGQVYGTRGATGGSPESTYTGALNNMPAGGVRVILGTHPTKYYAYTYSQAAGVDRDSIINPKAWVDASWPTTGYKYITYFPFPDSSYGQQVMVNYNGSARYAPTWGTTSFAPSVYASIGTTASLDVGGSALVNTNHRISVSPEIAYAALAYFDSLCGRDVLGASTNGQVRLAVQVSGGFSRGDQYSGGGIAPHDSTVLKASIDSLASLGIPIAVIANGDSLSQYAGDKAWWNRNSNTVYELSNYVSTVAPPSYAAYRDSLVAGYAALVSMVGQGRVDRVFAGARTDDWTPSDITPQSAAKWDSLLWALNSAGVRGVSNDAEADSEWVANVSPRGWAGPQAVYPATLAGAGASILKLCFPGYSNRGALEQHGKVSFANGLSGANDVARIAAAKAAIVQDSCFTAHYVQRSTYAMLLGYWLPNYDADRVFNVGNVMSKPWYGEPYLTGQVSKKASTMTGCNLVRITASSLGAGQHGAASPARPGYYQIKALVNIANAINTLAGRNLIVFVRPDQLSPADIRR